MSDIDRAAYADVAAAIPSTGQIERLAYEISELTKTANPGDTIKVRVPDAWTVKQAPAFEVWQITPQLRWRDLGNGKQALEQAWASPDGRLDWREVPRFFA